MAGDKNDKGGKRIQRFGRFEIVAHIASGGMGAVYKAYDPKAKDVIALKVMSPELAAKRNMIARFRREARSVTKLSHENIVAIREFGEENGTFYLALEFVDGKDLHEHISRSPGGRLDPEEARLIALQAARALDHAHRAGVVHRDVKPSNFLVIKRPEGPLVKLTDLGLARHEDDDEHRVTKVGTTLGTVDYMAPEQARDSGKADIRSDLYALGCTLYHMLAGKPPFPKGSMAEKIVQHIEAEPPDICKINEATPKTLGMIVRKLLAKKPRDRYQTPAELVEDLEDPERILEPREAPEVAKKPRKEVERVAPNPKLAPKAGNSDVLRKKPKRSKTAKSPDWTLPAIGGGVFVLVGIIVLIVMNSRRTPPVEKKTDDVVVLGKKFEPEIKPEPVKQIVGPLGPELKPLYQPVLPLERDALTKENFGPFTTFPEPPADAKVIGVSRMPLAEQTTVRSLGEAFAEAATQPAAVIEIRDQGPHFLTSLPVLRQRNLWIRGGPGIRPILAWNGEGAENLVQLRQGQLTLDNLDVVVHLHDNLPPPPLCLFQVQGGNVQARACTFSIAGKHAAGVVVARLQGMGPIATAALGLLQDAGPIEAKCRFTHCLARGASLSLVATHNTAADILIDSTLAVGGAQPLVQHANREEDSLTVRLVRSTLVAQQHLWLWRNSTGKGGAPRLKAFAWDAVLARSNAATLDGDMLHLADGGRTNLVSVKPVNCLYAGWRNLLGAGDKHCANLQDWRSVWGHREGDLALAEAWPPRPLGVLDELPAAALHPAETPAAFTATSGDGVIGCDLGRLPPEPRLWKQRTFERFVVPVVNLPETEIPEIPTAPEGLYHGEKIDLGKFDLGQQIQARLQTLKPGPRVVLHLTGKGANFTSPVRFKGVENIVLYFEQPSAAGKDKGEPLTLELKPGGGSAALIDVDGGSLEIQQGRFRYDNSRIAALPPHMIRVRGGDLRLTRCTLLGPLSKAPDSFQSLIGCEGAGLGGVRPIRITLRDCVLQSGKPIVEIKNSGVRLHCRGCLLYALGDAVAFDLNNLPTSRPDIVAVFENNTVALRQGFVNVRCFEAPPNCLPVVVQTRANYFYDPFPEEPRQAGLLRISGESLARGLFLWQGKENVFARDRLQGYFAAAEGTVGKQSFKDWEQLTGPLGDVDTQHIDAGVLKTFNPDNPAYERLTVPAKLSIEPAPGADLVKLGLVKKK